MAANFGHLTAQDAQRLTALAYDGNAQGISDELARINPHPHEVISYFARLVGRLLGELQPLPAGGMWAIDNQGTHPTPVYAQLVSAAANADEDTFQALLSTITTNERAAEAVAELLVMSSSTMSLLQQKTEDHD